MMTWYDDAMRTIIDLTDDQVKQLAEYCSERRVSRAEAIRTAVNALLNESAKERRKRLLRQSAGAWKHKGIDALEYQRALRAEWDR